MDRNQVFPSRPKRGGGQRDRRRGGQRRVQRDVRQAGSPSPCCYQQPRTQRRRIRIVAQQNKFMIINVYKNNIEKQLAMLDNIGII